MNKFLKLKNLLSRSKIFSKTFSLENYELQNILKIGNHNRKPLIISGAALGITVFGIGICRLAKVSYCSSVFDPFGWGTDTLSEENTLKEASVMTDVEEKIKTEKELESSVNQSSPVIYMNDSKDKVVNGIPTEVPYLIVGAGIAGMSAARTIRANDPLAKILIINSECQSPGNHHETYPPYRRILLSKYIWRRNEDNQKSLLDTSGDAKQSSFLFLEPDSFFVPPEKLHQCEFGAVSLLNGHRVIEVNPKESTVTLEFSNHKISYRACLLATGSRPKRLQHLEISDGTKKDLYNSGQVSYFRSLNDFRNLAEKITSLRTEKNPGKVLIIGSGLLGTELTSSLGRVAKDQGQLDIIEVFREKSHLFHILPEPLSRYLFNIISKSRIKLVPDSEVTSIRSIEDGPDQGRLAVLINPIGKSETTVEHVDHVIIAAGVEPDTSLAEHAQLETDPLLGGFLVNSELQSREGIYVAGDSCSFYDTNLGRRRVEHWNHSEESGNVAGHNMAAYVLRTSPRPVHPVDNSKVAYDVLKARTYDFQSSFSFKLNMYNSLDALGLIDSRLETRTFIATDFYDDTTLDTIEDSTGKPAPIDNVVKPASKHDPLDMPGVVFYLREKRVVGVLLWNCDDDIVIESDFPSPLRSNVARKLIAEQRIIESESDLIGLAADFDLSFFVNSQLKFLDEYTKKRQETENTDRDRDTQPTG